LNKKAVAEMAYKIVLSKQVKSQLKRTSKKDRKMLEKALKKLSENPFLGKPIDYEPMVPMPWENCKCGKPLIMLWDKNSDEVDISCANGKCDSFWATKEEIDTGREKWFNRELFSPSKISRRPFTRKRCKRHIWMAKCPSKGCRFAWCENCDSVRECDCKGCCRKSLK
jgi:hypothetical protein